MSCVYIIYTDLLMNMCMYTHTCIYDIYMWTYVTIYMCVCAYIQYIDIRKA